jgi:hypothetical protein
MHGGFLEMGLIIGRVKK